MFVCLSVRQQDNSRTCGPIMFKFGVWVAMAKRKKPIDFQPPRSEVKSRKCTFKQRNRKLSSSKPQIKGHVTSKGPCEVTNWGQRLQICDISFEHVFHRYNNEHHYHCFTPHCFSSVVMIALTAGLQYFSKIRIRYWVVTRITLTAYVSIFNCHSLIYTKIIYLSCIPVHILSPKTEVLQSNKIVKNLTSVSYELQRNIESYH